MRLIRLNDNSFHSSDTAIFLSGNLLCLLIISIAISFSMPDVFNSCHTSTLNNKYMYFIFTQVFLGAKNNLFYILNWTRVCKKNI